MTYDSPEFQKLVMQIATDVGERAQREGCSFEVALLRTNVETAERRAEVAESRVAELEADKELDRLARKQMEAELRSLRYQIHNHTCNGVAMVAHF